MLIQSVFISKQQQKRMRERRSWSSLLAVGVAAVVAGCFIAVAKPVLLGVFVGMPLVLSGCVMARCCLLRLRELKPIEIPARSKK